MEADNASQRSLAASEASGQGSSVQVPILVQFLSFQSLQWVTAAEHITMLSPHLHHPTQASGGPASGYAGHNIFKEGEFVGCSS